MNESSRAAPQALSRQDAPAGARRVTFSTLGCKLNLYETDALATRFQEGGYEVVDSGTPADVYIINSCTVTNRADRKSRNLLSRAQRESSSAGGPAAAADGPAPLVVMTGCFVDSHRDRLECEGNTFVVANQQKYAIYDLVQAHIRGEVLDPAGSVFDFPVPSRIFHTRTMLKIQDGCDNFCTFCIIPQVRGRAASRPPADILDAAREAVQAGAKELVLTGVNMSRYTYDDTGFTGLLQQLLEIDGAFRLRISSLEPDRLDDGFVELFDHPKMSPHLHLCLQSASERILLAMRRQYSFAQFVEVADRLRAGHPNFNLTTDMIVGFPGETEEEFNESLRAVEDLGFGHVQTFPYSEREGTRAARMPGRLPERVRTERAAAVRQAAAAAKERYRRRLVGTEQRLLVERVDAASAGMSDAGTGPESGPGTGTLPAPGVALGGFGQHYVPVRVAVSARSTGGHRIGEPADWQNTFVDVQITDIEDGDDPALLGEIVSDR